MELVKAIDLSSNQPIEQVRGIIQKFNPDHVIVRMYQADELPGLVDWSLRACDIVREEGKTLGAYGWLYGFGASPSEQVDMMLDTADKAGAKGEIPRLWLDLETYLTRANKLTWPTYEQAMEAANHVWKSMVTPGSYTGNWFVRDYWKRTDLGELADFDVWLSDFNSTPDLETYNPYWPNERLVGHQYDDSVIDLSVFLPQATILSTGVPVEPTNTPSYEDLVNLLGYLSGDVATDMDTTLTKITDVLSAPAKRRIADDVHHLEGLIEVVRKGAS